MNYEIVPGTDHDPEIARLYNSGKERGEIAEEMGLKPHYVTKRLSKLRQRGNLTRESQINAAKMLYSEVRVYLSRGLDAEQIARLTDVSVDEIERVITTIASREHVYSFAKCRRFAE